LDINTHEEVYGGDYWRQALFYKILMDNDKSRDWEMRYAEFDFVEPDKKSKEYIKHRVEITPADIDAVKKQVQQAYSGIMSHNFSWGCGHEDCEWCNFIKFNKVGI
jgi:DNA helicase-2/ATP-dependent DNA helicase PcrA